MPSRYLCDVLEDMRKMHETRNFSGLMGSIEQAQVMASRMEAALGDKRTIEQYDKDAAKLNRDIKAKRRELNEVTEQLGPLKKEAENLETQLKKLRHQWKKETRGHEVPPHERDYRPIKD